MDEGMIPDYEIHRLWFILQFVVFLDTEIANICSRSAFN